MGTLNSLCFVMRAQSVQSRRVFCRFVPYRPGAFSPHSRLLSSTCQISNPALFSKDVTVKDNSQTTRIEVLLTILTEERLWRPVNFNLKIDFNLTFFYCGKMYVAENLPFSDTQFSGSMCCPSPGPFHHSTQQLLNNHSPLSPSPWQPPFCFLSLSGTTAGTSCEWDPKVLASLIGRFHFTCCPQGSSLL